MINEDLKQNLEKISILYNGLQSIISESNLNKLDLYKLSFIININLDKYSKLIISYDTSNGTLDRNKDYGDTYDSIFVSQALGAFDFLRDKEIETLVLQSSLKENEKISLNKNTSFEEFLQLAFSKYIPVLSAQNLEEKLPTKIKADNTKKAKI